MTHQHPDTGDLKAGDHVILRRKQGLGTEAIWGRINFLAEDGELSVHSAQDGRYYGWTAGDEIEKDQRP